MSVVALSRQSKLYLAFFLIYFIWGSTYLAIRYAVATIPPFLMAGSRFTLAGLVMLVWLRWRGVALPTWPQFLRLSVVGIFLFVGGNGLVVWAEQYIDSGLAALLVSTLPLWLILLDWRWAGGPPPTLRAAIGVALGIVGTVVLVQPQALLVRTEATDLSRTAALASAIVVFASVLWAIGSIYQKKIERPKSVFMSAACQMTGGGVVLLLLAGMQQEWQQFDVQSVTLVSFAGWAYLFCFGSMIAISAYVWLLQNAPAAAVSTYAFVNPVVALWLGWLIADEPMTLTILVGAGIILSGVLLVVMTPPSRR